MERITKEREIRYRVSLFPSEDDAPMKTCNSVIPCFIYIYIYSDFTTIIQFSNEIKNLSRIIYRQKYSKIFSLSKKRGPPPSQKRVETNT